MQQLITDNGWVALALIVILVCFCVLLAQINNRLRRERAERKQQELLTHKQRKLKSDQVNIGGRIYNELRRAAAENPNKIVVSKNENNGGCYSIWVRHNRPDMYTHLQPCFQVNVKSLGDDNRITVYQPYNSSWEWGTSEFDIKNAIGFLTDKTKKFGVDGNYGPYSS